MSVINQVLLDLEKRRASGAERGKLHTHVRALPEGTGVRRTRRQIVLGGALFIATVTWAAVNAVDWAGSAPATRGAAAPPLAAPIATRDENRQTPAEAAPTAAAPVEMQLAARLSFELSRLPESLPEPEARPAAGGAIASTRVIAKAPGEARVVPVRAAAVETVPAEPKRSDQPVARRDPSPAARTADAAAAANSGAIDKRVRQPTAQQLAEAEFRKATALLHQSRIEEAREGFEAAVSRYPGHHGARQALLGVLVETGRKADAERIMQDGLQLAPHQIGFAMALARLQVDRGDSAAAIASLQKSAGHARASGEYLAFLAGLLQREHRDAEAVEQFQAALRVKPNYGLWLLGLGISLQELGRDAEAREAFQRARASMTLSADLQALAELRLQRLR